MTTQTQTVIDTKLQLDELPIGTILIDEENGSSYRIGKIDLTYKALFTQDYLGQEIVEPIHFAQILADFVPLTVLWVPKNV